jgi:DNA invertase Pin-like site-specific DNA recombinase
VKRVALYTRVSKPEQTIAMQIDAATPFIAQRGWTLVATFKEEGMSGAKAKRPELSKLLEGARRGLFDVILVWKGDRLFRSLQHMVATMNDLAAWGVDYVSVTESFVDTTTPTGRFFRNFFALLAEWERDTIAERSAAGVAAARRRGKRIGRPPVRFDVGEARELVEREGSMRAAAKILKVPRSVLHRALQRRTA